MGDKKQPSQGFYDIRRGKQRPWRALLKRIDEAIEGEAPAERVRAIAEVFLYYVDDRLEDRRQRRQAGGG